MFQNGTSSLRKALITGLIACGWCFTVWAANTDFDRDTYLAQVEIDDLLASRETTTDPVVTPDDQQASTKVQSEKKPLSKLKPKVDSKLDETMVLAEIKRQIASHFEISDEFRIFFDRSWDEITLTSPAWELVVTSFPSQGLRSRFFVNFEIWCDGERLSSYQVGVHCELWKDAYLAQRQIERGTILNEGYVIVQPVDILSLYQSPVEIGTVLSDYVANNSIKQGEPVYQRDLKERPLIEKNAVIDVFAQEGMMRITLKGKALEDGVKGQFIRVRNLQSHSDIQAEVVGVNQARVYF